MENQVHKLSISHVVVGGSNTSNDLSTFDQLIGRRHARKPEEKALFSKTTNHRMRVFIGFAERWMRTKKHLKEATKVSGPATVSETQELEEEEAKKR